MLCTVLTKICRETNHAAVIPPRRTAAYDKDGGLRCFAADVRNILPDLASLADAGGAEQRVGDKVFVGGS